MVTLRLVPVSPDLHDFDTITISKDEQDKVMILGRGKLTGINDTKVSRSQVCATFRAPDPQTGESAYLSIKVQGGKPSFIFRNANTAETIEVRPQSEERVYHNDLLYLIRDRFAYRFEVVEDENKTDIGPPRKKRRTENGERSLSELELLQQEHEKLKASSAKTIRLLNTKLSEKTEFAKDLETNLDKLERKNFVLETTVDKLQKQINQLKASEAKEKARYNTLKAEQNSTKIQKDTNSPTTTPNRKRNRTNANKRGSKDFNSEDISEKKDVSNVVMETSDLSATLNEDSSQDLEMEEPSENDELQPSEITELEKKQIGDSWIDGSGQKCRWISDIDHTDGVNRYFSSVLIDNRLFKLGDTVYVYSPRGSEPYIGKIICLYQTPLNKRRVQIQWFFYPNDLITRFKLTPKEIECNNTKKELFASTRMDVNDVAVLDKHCYTKNVSEESSIDEIISWAQAASGRFFWSKYFDCKKNHVTTSPDEISKAKFQYPLLNCSV